MPQLCRVDVGPAPQEQFPLRVRIPLTDAAARARRVRPQWHGELGKPLSAELWSVFFVHLLSYYDNNTGKPGVSATKLDPFMIHAAGEDTMPSNILPASPDDSPDDSALSQQPHCRHRQYLARPAADGVFPAKDIVTSADEASGTNIVWKLRCPSSALTHLRQWQSLRALRRRLGVRLPRASVSTSMTANYSGKNPSTTRCAARERSQVGSRTARQRIRYGKAWSSLAA